MPAAATITTMPILFAGDVVTIGYAGHEGKEYVVHEVKRKNALVKPKGQPDARGVLPDMALCVKTGETCMDDINAADENHRMAQAAVAIARAEVTPKEGAIVRLNRKCGSYVTGTLMSVAKVNSTTIGLHRLGGDNTGEHGMRIDPRGVTVVDLTDLAAILPVAN